MFNTFRFLSILFLILSVSFLVACGSDSASSNKTNPKELVTEAINKSMEMESYAFEGDLVISIDLDESIITGPDEEMVATLLKDLKVDYRGTYQADIEQAEFIFETNLNLGDLKTALEIPILIKQEKIWIKIPAIPGMIPDEFAGKQLELDLKMLAEMSGEEYVSIFDTANPQNMEQIALVQKIMDIFLRNLDDALFALSSVDGESVVTIDLSGDTFHSVLETMMTSTLPEVIELLEQEEYAGLLGLSEADLTELKELKNGLPEEMNEVLEEVKGSLQVNKGEFVFHINKDKFVSKQQLNLDLIFVDPESDVEVSFAISSNQHTTRINEEQEFILEEPTENILDLAALFGLFMPYDLGADLSPDYPFDSVEELEMDLEPIDALFYALFEEEWFNDPEIQELLFTDQRFQEALYDQQVLEQLLNDLDFRKSFFAEFGIEIN